MFLLKLFGKAALALALLGAAAGIIAASGCGSYIPHEPGTDNPGDTPGIEEPDDTPGENPGTEEPDTPGTEEPEEPDNPGTEEPETTSYVNTSLYVGDYSVSSASSMLNLLTYTGELNNVHIQFDYSTEYEPFEGITDRAYLSIGTGGKAILEAGKTYTLTVTNNGGYFWENNFGLTAIELASWGDWNAAEVYDFMPGTVTFTPDTDIWLLEVQLLPYPISAAGKVDFYLSLTTT